MNNIINQRTKKVMVSHSGHKINIVTRALTLSLSLGHKSQYARDGPAVLTLLFEDRNFYKKS